MNLALRDLAGLSARRTAQRKTGWLSKQAKAAIRFARPRPSGLCVQFMHGVKIFAWPPILFCAPTAHKVRGQKQLIGGLKRLFYMLGQITAKPSWELPINTKQYTAAFAPYMCILSQVSYYPYPILFIPLLFLALSPLYGVLHLV